MDKFRPHPFGTSLGFSREPQKQGNKLRRLILALGQRRKVDFSQLFQTGPDADQSTNNNNDDSY